MDILLVNAPIYSLPSTQRAAALVYDGTCDLRLWRPPGPDRDLLDVYGEGFYDVLDKERTRLPGGTLAIAEVVRLHPGKLHCDFLVWAAGRPPHGTTAPAPAPSGEVLRNIVHNALALCARYGAIRVAFPALGAGVGALDPAERLAIVVRAAREYMERCFAEGRSPGVEEVLVCERSAAALAKARQAVASLTRTAPLPAPSPSLAASGRRTASGERMVARGGGAAPRRAASKRGPVRLDPSEVAAARAGAQAYDRARLYFAGEWFLHPKFGVGRVEEVHPERMVSVLFEDGERRKMVHGRP